MMNRLQTMLRKNTVVLRDVDDRVVTAEKNKVNLNGWFLPGRDVQNIGDWLSKIVVDHVAARCGIDPEKKVSRTKHLYAIGSILLGFQDATIWGSGFLNDSTHSRSFAPYAFLHRHWHTTDVRAVRGPETRRILLKMGIECPEVYGDPAILMPLFYTPRQLPHIPYALIPHFVDVKKYAGDPCMLHTFNGDYRLFIDRVCSAGIVYSASLHGIILAESYGIPAILLNAKGECPFKYRDYYHSTGRFEIPVARSLEEAMTMTPLPVPDLTKMQEALLRAFPVDLWEGTESCAKTRTSQL